VFAIHDTPRVEAFDVEIEGSPETPLSCGSWAN
jgi:hypothetical protein